MNVFIFLCLVCKRKEKLKEKLLLFLLSCSNEIERIKKILGHINNFWSKKNQLVKFSLNFHSNWADTNCGHEWFEFLSFFAFFFSPLLSITNEKIFFFPLLSSLSWIEIWRNSCMNQVYKIWKLEIHLYSQHLDIKNFFFNFLPVLLIDAMHEWEIG